MIEIPGEESTVISGFRPETREDLPKNPDDWPLGLYSPPGTNNLHYHQIEINWKRLDYSLTHIRHKAARLARAKVDPTMSGVQTAMVTHLRGIARAWNTSSLARAMWINHLTMAEITHELQHGRQQVLLEADFLYRNVSNRLNFPKLGTYGPVLVRLLTNFDIFSEYQATLTGLSEVASTRPDLAAVIAGYLQCVRVAPALTTARLENACSVYVIAHPNNFDYIFNKGFAHFFATALFFTRNPNLLSQLGDGTMDATRLQQSLASGITAFIASPESFLKPLVSEASMQTVDNQLRRANQSLRSWLKS